jgi:hypothetical protein
MEKMIHRILLAGLAGLCVSCWSFGRSDNTPPLYKAVMRRES